MTRTRMNGTQQNASQQTTNQRDGETSPPEVWAAMQQTGETKEVRVGGKRKS